MTNIELRNRLVGINARYINGKDCSEYAEDAFATVNEGIFITFTSVNSLGVQQKIRCNFFGNEEYFVYHTVLLVITDSRTEYIIDFTNIKNTVMRKNDYVNILKKLNKNNIIILSKGQYNGNMMLF